jgi:hypothetical protein
LNRQGNKSLQLGCWFGAVCARVLLHLNPFLTVRSNRWNSLRACGSGSCNEPQRGEWGAADRSASTAEGAEAEKGLQGSWGAAARGGVDNAGARSYHSGMKLLFLPGASGNRQFWDPVKARLEQGFDRCPLVSLPRG